MAIENGYFTLADFTTRFWNSTPSVDADRDAQIEMMITAASRAIDDFCMRRFWKATETRYFTALWHDLLFVPDLVSITTLKTDNDNDRVYETVWTVTDYDLEPENAPLMVPPIPYNMIRIQDNGDFSFPQDIRRGVEIAGVWGFNTVPPEIMEACFLKAARLYKRKDTILGVSANTTLGQTVVKAPEDNDVIQLITPFIVGPF